MKQSTSSVTEQTTEQPRGVEDLTVSIPYDLTQDDAGSWFAFAHEIGIVSPDVYGYSDIKDAAITGFRLRALMRYQELLDNEPTLDARARRELAYLRGAV